VVCVYPEIAVKFRDHGTTLQAPEDPGADVPSSKVAGKSPHSPSINFGITLGLVSMRHSITTLPAEFLTAIECFLGEHPSRYICY